MASSPVVMPDVLATVGRRGAEVGSSAPGASGTLPFGRTTWHGAATVTMAGREAILLSAVALYMDHPE